LKLQVHPVKDKVKKKINSLFFPLGPAFIFLFFYFLTYFFSRFYHIFGFTFWIYNNHHFITYRTH